MAVAVPAGSHHVEATFGNTPIRTTANAVTAVSIITWLVSIFLASGVEATSPERLRGGALTTKRGWYAPGRAPRESDSGEVPAIETAGANASQ
jgi:hypothetical protein